MSWRSPRSGQLSQKAKEPRDGAEQVQKGHLAGHSHSQQENQPGRPQSCRGHRTRVSCSGARPKDRKPGFPRDIPVLVALFRAAKIWASPGLSVDDHTRELDSSAQWNVIQP